MKIRILLLTAFCIFMLNGCGQKAQPEEVSEPPPPIAEETPEPQEDMPEPLENKLVISMQSAADSLDPALNTTIAGNIILSNVFEGLYMTDEKDLPYPAAASSCDISGGGLTYTFHIRPALKWSDGRPVTAKDFEYAWKRALNPETGSVYARLLYYIKNAEQYNLGDANETDLGIKAIDDRTLRVDLVAPCEYFLGLTAHPVYFPVREDIAADNENWHTNPDTFVSNGKYTIAENNDYTVVKLVKNEEYWGADEVILDAVEIIGNETVASGYIKFMQGEYDAAAEVPPSEILAGRDAGLVHIYPMPGTYFICLNIDEKMAEMLGEEAVTVLRDVKVRQALSYAVNRKEITDNIRKDGSVPAYGFVPPAITNADGDAFSQNQYFPPEGDAEKARLLLEEAGYPNGDGFPALSYLYGEGAFNEQIAEALQKMWKEVLNINVQIIGDDGAAVSESRKKRGYEMARHGWLADFNDPDAFLTMWLSMSEQNDAGYNNKEYDNMLLKAQNEPDAKLRAAALNDAEAILMNDMPVIPLFYYSGSIAVQPYVKGLTATGLSNIYFDKVYFEK